MRCAESHLGEAIMLVWFVVSLTFALFLLLVTVVMKELEADGLAIFGGIFATCLLLITAFLTPFTAIDTTETTHNLANQQKVTVTVEPWFGTIKTTAPCSVELKNEDDVLMIVNTSRAASPEALDLICNE